MTGRPERPRFTVVTTQAKRSRGSQSYRLVMNDSRREGLVVHATVRKSLEAGERHLSLERLEIRLVGGVSGSRHDVVHLLGDPRWIRALLRAVAAHLQVEMDPRAIDTRILGEGAADPLRRFWRTLQGGEPRQQTAPLPPLPPITEEVVDQLMEEIDTFLEKHPEQKPRPESE